MPSATDLYWVAGCIAVLVTLELVARTPIYPRVLKYLGGPDPDYPRPSLQDGESVLVDDRWMLSRGLFGARSGVFLITTLRLMWYEDTKWGLWPFKGISGELDLSQVASVEKGWFLARLFGGIRLRLRNGKTKAFSVKKPDESMTMIRQVIGADRLLG